jgi:hypothetical protein
VKHALAAPAFYYLTDPATAQKLADRGFADAGVWSHQSTVTLMDNVPGDTGGGILRVSLTSSEGAAVCRHESSDPSEGYRKFLVPLELLTSAYVALVRR